MTIVQKKVTVLDKILAPLLVFIILGACLMYAFLQIKRLTSIVSKLTVEVAETKIAISRNEEKYSKDISSLRKDAVGISTKLSTTEKNIDAVKNQVGGVEQTVGSISGTVTTLQKLSKVDAQLLKKYSKVYFLNENYTPSHLVTLDSEYTYSSTKKEQFLTESSQSLIDLLKASKKDNVTIYVKSAYRSFAEQKSLKSTYTTTYGAGSANAFSADQGYSEHQLGTTVDFITTGLGGQLTGFEKTQAYTWLTTNAYRFGFILSYPKGNSYYVYEPWHWRYVGIKLATYLHNNNKNFYDMDQRDIDTYLINLFD